MRSYGATTSIALDGTQSPPRYIRIVKSYYQCVACGSRAAWRKGQNGGGFWELVKEKKESTVKEKMLKDIEKRLKSDYFGRAEASEALQGIMSRETLRALDRKGKGPDSTMAGGRRRYERRSFMAWLATLITEPDTSNN